MNRHSTKINSTDLLLTVPWDWTLVWKKGSIFHFSYDSVSLNNVSYCLRVFLQMGLFLLLSSCTEISTSFSLGFHRHSIILPLNSAVLPGVCPDIVTSVSLEASWIASTVPCWSSGCVDVWNRTKPANFC